MANVMMNALMKANYMTLTKYVIFVGKEILRMVIFIFKKINAYLNVLMAMESLIMMKKNFIVNIVKIKHFI